MGHRYPDSPVLYRNLRRDFPLAVRGEGCWLYDADGKAYLDAVGGAFVASLGHGNKEIAAAIGEQAGRLAYVNGTQFTSKPAEALAILLTEKAPGDLAHAYFLGSGSEAVEATLKLARQYWVESGVPSKHKVLSLTPGYHGNTMLALAASGRPRYQTYFKDWLSCIRPTRNAKSTKSTLIVLRTSGKTRRKSTGTGPSPRPVNNPIVREKQPVKTGGMPTAMVT